MAAPPPLLCSHPPPLSILPFMPWSVPFPTLTTGGNYLGLCPGGEKQTEVFVVGTLIPRHGPQGLPLGLPPGSGSPHDLGRSLCPPGVGSTAGVAFRECEAMRVIGGATTHASGPRVPQWAPLCLLGSRPLSSPAGALVAPGSSSASLPLVPLTQVDGCQAPWPAEQGEAGACGLAPLCRWED